MTLLSNDWHAILAFETPLFELLVRSSVLYFVLLLLVRLLPRRTGGELANMDLIFILLITEGAAHAMGEYTSVADGLVTIATLVAWNWSINALSFHVPAIERLVAAAPLQIIRDGKLLRRNMRREYLTMEEIKANLHKEGLDDISQVKSAYVEGDGHITFVPVERD